jgi:hypothetical protein
MKQTGGSGNSQVTRSVHRGMGLVTAVLLLTGQITIGGVFIAPSDFALSLSGFFTGSGAFGVTDRDNFVLDGLDIIAAFLLILNQLQVIGTYITAKRFSIVVGGPIFGGAEVEGYTPSASQFFNDFGSILVSIHNPFKGGQ